MELHSDEGPVLSSWKEIAAYFDRDVRTVQRWEKEQGLPVRRHQHARGTSVYAYEGELAAWWANGEHAADPTGESPPWRLRGQRSLALVTGVAAVALSVAVVTTRPRARLAEATIATMPGGRPAISFHGQSEASRLTQFVSGDLDGDGADDLVLSSDGGGIAVLLAPDAKLTGGLAADVATTIIRAGPSRLVPTAVGDWNGDGLEDLLVTESLDEETSYYRSATSYLLLGRTEWPDVISLPEGADSTLPLHHSPDARPTPYPAADVDGDGIDDMLFGANEYRVGDTFSAGAVFVVYGRRNWPSELPIDGTPDVAVFGSELGHGLGGSLATGDVDGDGLLDLAVIASRGNLWNLGGSNGALCVFLGSESWPSRLEAADAALVISDEDHRIGNGSVLLADIDGDGRDDVILGQPADWIQQHPHGGPGDPDFPGVIEVWLGSSAHRGAKSRDSADITIRGTQPGEWFGDAVAAADLDGDGAEDLVVARSGQTLMLIYGRERWMRNGTAADHGALSVFDAEPTAGTWTVGTSDLDGDGLAEILLTASDSVTGAAVTGRVWILSPYLPVAADYRPMAHPNVVVPGGVGAIRLDNLGSPPGEVLDAGSVRVNGVAPLTHVERDYDLDGVLEVQVWVDNDRLGLAAGLHRLPITGRTRSGYLVGGSDIVEALPRRPTAHSATHRPTER